LATIFLVFTKAKSPIGFLPVVLFATAVLTRIRSRTGKFALVLSLVGLVNLFTAGTVVWEPVHRLVAALGSDASYTGRDEIWEFTLAHIAQRPVAGFGFQAFWGTSELVLEWNAQQSWGYRASDAHSGYLNLAVMTGLVGLALALVWIVLQPIVDVARGIAQRADPALSRLFMRIWLFGLCLASVESVFFSGGSELWFMTIVAIVGFRFMSIARLRR
jgi:O-antigen ligase